MWKDLFTNFAVIALVVSLWTQAQYWQGGQRTWRQKAMFGAIMGAGAIASMMLSVPMGHGFIYDLRTALIALAAGFGGPIAALVAGGLAGSYRIYLGGGGTMTGLMSLVIAAAVGLLVSYFSRKRWKTPLDVLVLSIGAAADSLFAVTQFTGDLTTEAFHSLAWPHSSLTFAATGLGGAVILLSERISRERLLLRAAAAQSTDFQYVKNRKGEFISANIAVARHHGFKTPAGMIGKTDFDIDTPERAERFLAEEQEMMRTGVPMEAFDEEVIDRKGVKHWFSTTKSPVYDDFGVAIGTAGVTRDITQRKRLEHQLASNRRQLALALSEMADGVAMFAPNGRLILCNERYRKSFPITGDMRRPGALMRDILRKVIETGEQVLPEGDPQVWIEETLANLRREGSQEIHLNNGHWLQLRRRLAPDGTTLVVVSDITNLKTNELALQMSTRRLRQLASIDALTGLPNRRTFDERLSLELARAGRNSTTLSLLLIDIDHFKAFNDSYGHLAGDKCLRLVAKCLSDCLERPGDSVARYGGEEFTIILPETDPAGAEHIALRIKARLAEAAIPHRLGINGVVTVSTGIAWHEGRPTAETASQLFGRADQALYQTKAAGRDGICLASPNQRTGTD